ncbi:MAG: GAF domain-containing protein, partial [Patescibacteria group bacterium]
LFFILSFYKCSDSKGKFPQALLLEKTTRVLTGTYDFQKLAQQAVDLIVHEQPKDILISAAIFRAYPEKNEMRAYAYTTRGFRKVIDSLLPVKFEDLRGSLSWTDNLTMHTYLSNKMQSSTKLSDFSKHIWPDIISDTVQKTLKARLFITFPITLKSGKVAGVFMYSSPRTEIPMEELNLFQTFAHQLGLAFSNVFAFERLMQKYKKDSATDSLTKPETNTPSVKFTLRITPNQLKNLERVSKAQQKNKADLIRDLLDKQIISE